MTMKQQAVTASSAWRRAISSSVGGVYGVAGSFRNVKNTSEQLWQCMFFSLLQDFERR